MGSVVQLKKTINNSYSDLLKSVEDKLILVNEKISLKLTSKVDLIQNMTEYHLDTGGKKLRALLTCLAQNFVVTQKDLEILILQPVWS